MRDIPSPPPPLLDVLLHSNDAKLDRRIDAAIVGTDSSTLHNKSKMAPRDPRLSVPPVPERRETEADPEMAGENGQEEGELSAAGNKPKRREGKVLCKYWMEGKCSKGDACTFNHAHPPNRTPTQIRTTHQALLTMPPAALLALATTSAKPLWSLYTEAICRFEMAGAGHCSKGAHCLFSHDLHLVPCRYWHAWGRCAAAGQCRFSHAAVDGELSARIRLEAHQAVHKERAEGKRKRAKVDPEQLNSTENISDNVAYDDALDDAQLHEELAKFTNPFAL